jgi:hypothetical protein
MEWHFDVGPVSIGILLAVLRGVYHLGKLAKWKEATDTKLLAHGTSIRTQGATLSDHGATIGKVASRVRRHGRKLKAHDVLLRPAGKAPHPGAG